jgi:hypothetical protein
VHAPLGFGLHRCPPVRIGGHHRHERTCDDQDGMAGRSRPTVTASTWFCSPSA